METGWLGGRPGVMIRAKGSGGEKGTVTRKLDSRNVCCWHVDDAVTEFRSSTTLGREWEGARTTGRERGSLERR